MVWIVMIAAVVVLLGISLATEAKGERAAPAPPLEPAPLDEPSPSELALEDPVEALLRYGNPADAARLSEQGVDLAALGYRGPGA